MFSLISLHSARKLLLRHYQTWASLFCHPANGICPSAIFKRDAPPECPGPVPYFDFDFDFFSRYFLSPFTPHPSPSEPYLVLFARQGSGGREGTGERETPPGSEVVDGEVVVFTALSQAVHRPAPGGALSELSGALCFLLSISLSLRVFASCVPALGVGLRSHSSMPRQRSPATGFPFAARRDSCRPASSASALCARPAPSRARREPR